MEIEVVTEVSQNEYKKIEYLRHYQEKCNLKNSNGKCNERQQDQRSVMRCKVVENQAMVKESGKRLPEINHEKVNWKEEIEYKRKRREQKQIEFERKLKNQM